jgi:hypothetical protein
MDSGGEQCLLTLALQNAIQRELEFRILKVAAFTARLQDPNVVTHRFRANDSLLEFLETL